MKTFETFTRGGVKYLAATIINNVQICDESGNNYGSYFSVESFEQMASRNGGFDKLILGKCDIIIRNL